MLPHTRPRERAWKNGVASLSDVELLAILLRTGRKGTNALQLAHGLLKEFDGDWEEMAQGDSVRIVREGKVGKGQAITVLAALELGKRMPQKNSIPKKMDEAIIEVVQRIAHEPKELLFLICLDLRNTCIGSPVLIKEGTRLNVYADLREILNKAIQRGAGRIILLHNHPSQDAQPSVNDRMVTKQVLEGSAWVDIQLMDHVIVTKHQTFSMRANGMLD